MTQKHLLCLAMLLLLGQYSTCYGSQITISTAASPSITDFYQDFSYCTCDLSPSLCDNYCCCDSTCSSSAISTWTASSSCLSSAQTLEDFCNQTSTAGFGVFSDLACVYQSNRGVIGNYYLHPSTASISYPSASKFASITPNTATQEFQTSATGVTLGSPYSTSNPYLSATSSTFFYAPQPGLSGQCVPGPLNISSSQTSKCFVTPTLANCATLNSNYAGTICLNGACSLTSTAATITSASISGSACNSVLTGLTISYTISSSGSSYILSSATITPAYINVNIGSSAVVTVTQTVTAPTAYSGRPGYQLAKALTITPSLSAFADSSTGNCYATSSATGSTKILFGQGATYRCASSSPCSTAYYIDSLISSTITIQKYASESTETVTVSGTAVGSNGCNYQGYKLQIVYSYSGWELAPQYYVAGAKLVPYSSPDTPTNPSKKYFSIEWIYVDPKTVSNPPSNLFYEYFSQLWMPLKQKFGLSS